MSKWVIALVLAAGAVAPAQDEKKSGQEKSSFEKHAYPFEGEVTTERLNVRMFPKADNTSVIAAILGMGEKVTVVGERDDFYQILPPKGCTAWIFTKHVKKEGEFGIVTVNDTPVRIDSRSNADKLCALNEGDKVRIIVEHMGWFKIESPVAVKYYVGKKYVKYVKDVDAKSLTTETSKKEGPKKTDDDAEALAKMKEAEALAEQMYGKINAEDFDSVDFSGVIRLFEEAVAKAKSDAIRKDAEKRLQFYRDMQKVFTTLKLGTEDIKKKLEEVHRQREALENARREKVYVFTGYVDCTSFSMPNRPGTHKLVSTTGDGGKIVCFLKIKEGDEAMRKRLNDHYKRYVGVNGTVVKDPEGWAGYSVVIVDDVQLVELKK